MKTIKTEKLIFIDVDDTLIMWTWSKKYNEQTIRYKDPYSSKSIEVLPNKPNITILKEKASRGYTVCVWSAGGYEHAASVIKALRLCSYVDYVMSKPAAYVDDKDVSHWFPRRVYLNYNVRYKSDRET